MEGLEMGVEGTGGHHGTASWGMAPLVRRRQCRGLPGLVTLPTLAARGMFCCRNSSAALFLPRLCCWLCAGTKQLGAPLERLPPVPTTPRPCRGGAGGRSLDPE